MEGLYHKRIFRSVSNASNGEAGKETFFYYQQQGELVTAYYQGGSILLGQLIALADEKGVLDMRYQHLSHSAGLMTGICRSVPEILPDGRIRLHEQWEWTSGDKSTGSSVIEEIHPDEAVPLLQLLY
jgi:hypothetical protein